MRKLLCFAFLLGVMHQGLAQKTTTVDRPKLVVGIVVDQMRYDYLTRFYNHYGNDGFKRLLNEGFNSENAHFNYIPTYTAVGHASVYTGTTPSIHGIIGNNWYDKFKKKYIYCVDDHDFETVGTKSGGEKSPNRMKTTTITDELRLTQQMNGKTVALSIKDRSAVLPGGHTANGAYWFRGKSEGKFITSSYYMSDLPDWVKAFNKKEWPKTYLEQGWDTFKDIDLYKESLPDDNPYEGKLKGKEKPTFPYNLKALAKDNGGYDVIKATPHGNSLLVEFAKAAILGEQLGKRDYTDFLAISFSSPDYVGHNFGVDSKEVQDTYIRLDRDLANLLTYLDNEVGKGQYTLFLTADHAAVQVPSYLIDQKVPAGYFDTSKFRKYLNTLLKDKYGVDKMVEHFSNWQVFLNQDSLDSAKLDRDLVAEFLADQIINYDGIAKVVTAKSMRNTYYKERILKNLQSGYNQKISGDVLIVPFPATIMYSRTGSTHGSGFNYDTHVPVILYGKGIKRGRSKSRVEIIDIAPTIANLLQISFPNGSTGRIIKESLE